MLSLFVFYLNFSREESLRDLVAQEIHLYTRKESVVSLGRCGNHILPNCTVPSSLWYLVVVVLLLSTGTVMETITVCKS